MSAAVQAQDSSKPEAASPDNSPQPTQSANTKRVRKDIPWVSLEHQRALAKLAEGGVQDKAQEEKEDPKKLNYLSKIAKSATPELSADKFEYADDGSGKLVAKGSAKISDKSFEILSDKIEYAKTEGYAKGSGDVKISTDSARITARDIYINFKDDAMSTQYIRFGSSPLFVESSALDGTRTKVELKDSVMYFGEPSWSSMTAEASSISYDKETDILAMEDVTLGIGEVPFFYVPSYSQHGLKKPPFDVNTRFGYNNDYGAYIRTTTLYNGLEDVSPGLLVDYYTKRSVLVGPAVSYDTELTSTILKGWAQGAYINDHGSESVRGVDSLGNQIGRDRYFAEFRHSQMISDRVGITGNLSYWSDEFATRDFRPEFFYDNQVPDNFGEAVYYGDFFTTSVFTRFAPNDWEVVKQRLPEVRVDMQPVEIFSTGAYQRAFASYAYLREFDPVISTDYKYSNRADLYYGVDRPIALSSWSKFTPVIGGRLTYYANAVNNRSTYTRVLGQVGFDAQMDAWGSWEYQSEIMHIDGIRHHLIPQISYRYIPKADQGDDSIPQIDTDYLTTYPPVLDLGTLRNVDQIYDTNTMRFGLQNIFETRDEEYGSREIARFDLYQDVNFNKRPVASSDEKESFSDFYVNASVSPARWLTIGTYTRMSVNNIGIPETNSYLGLFDGDALSVYLITSYLAGSITQYSVLADYRISEIYKVMGKWSYDERLCMLTEQSYGLSTRMGNSWIIEYIISQRSGSTRQNNFSFGVRVTMLMF